MERLNSNTTKPIKFVKHMAKFLDIKLDRKHFYGDCIRHIFLVRNPLKQLNSWKTRLHVHNEEYSLESSGLIQLVQLYSQIKRNSPDNPPIVVDSVMLNDHPAEVLQKLCQLLCIPYYASQLHWEPGPKPGIDG